MASAPGQPQGIFARIDAGGRLVEADPMLVALQVEAGAALGAKLALPQLAAVARLVRKLGIAVSRPAVIAARDYDLELWVRGEPDGDDVLLWVESSRRRPPASPRLEAIAAGDEFDAIPGARVDWSTDAELRFTDLSADFAALLGIIPADAIGQPLTRVLRLEEDGEGAMPMLAALAARSDFSGQAATARGHGGQRLILSGSPVPNEDGGFGGFHGSAVAEPKAMPQPANEGGVAAISIDPDLDAALRSPLDRIIAAAEGIVDRAEGPLRSDYAEYAGDISAAAKHLLSVIRSMADHAPGVPDSVDLANLAAEAVNLVEPQAEGRSISFQRLGNDRLSARGEARGIIQILVNLLGNAVRHSPDGGTITVLLGSQVGMATVTIADQGPGIAAADQERVFAKFERLGENGHSGNGAHGGAGLGLAIARRLARSMGGEIGLVSEPAQGARFTLSLPAA